MNSNKSELFFGGYLDIEKIMFSDLFGTKLVSFQQGIWVCLWNQEASLSYEFATVYRKKNRDVACLDMKYLSLRVRYGKVNFWSSVFVLPKDFMPRLTLFVCSMWRRKSSYVRGERVAWKDVGKPKEEGDLCNDSYEELTRGQEKTGLTGNSQYIQEEIASV